MKRSCLLIYSISKTFCFWCEIMPLLRMCWFQWNPTKKGFGFCQSRLAILYKVMGTKKKSWAISTLLTQDPFLRYLGQLGFYTILFSLCWDVYHSLSEPSGFRSNLVGHPFQSHWDQKKKLGHLTPSDTGPFPRLSGSFGFLSHPIWILLGSLL